MAGEKDDEKDVKDRSHVTDSTNWVDMGACYWIGEVCGMTRCVSMRPGVGNKIPQPAVFMSPFWVLGCSPFLCLQIPSGVRKAVPPDVYLAKTVNHSAVSRSPGFWTLALDKYLPHSELWAISFLSRIRRLARMMSAFLFLSKSKPMITADGHSRHSFSKLCPKIHLYWLCAVGGLSWDPGETGPGAVVMARRYTEAFKLPPLLSAEVRFSHVAM